jgi:hypothetical protein
MKRYLFALAVTLLCIAATTDTPKSFEGLVTYKNAIKSKIKGATDAQILKMMGDKMDYYFKEGNYKTVCNGSLIQWQLYDSKTNRLYTKVALSETIYYNDAAENKDTLLTTKVNKGVATILGYKCDEVILTTTSGIEKYYFNSKFAVDPALYSRHLYQNFYDYLKVAKALPLKMILDTKELTVTSEATKITPTAVDDKEFQLPEGAQTEKNPN